MTTETEIWQDTLPGQVSAGAEWLDEYYPGWNEHINVFALNMVSEDACILGQVGHSMLADRIAEWEDDDPSLRGLSAYAKILDIHARPCDWGIRYGFCMPNGSDVDVDEWERQVTLLWISEVHSRMVRED